jgi:hypothetical protein
MMDMGTKPVLSSLKGNDENLSLMLLNSFWHLERALVDNSYAPGLGDKPSRARLGGPFRALKELGGAGASGNLLEILFVKRATAEYAEILGDREAF